MFSSHGIGNAIVINYAKHGREIFEKGCVPKLTDFVEPASRKRFGSPDDASLFVLQNYVKVPEKIPTALTTPCVTFALTQPTDEVQRAIRTAEEAASSSKTAPRVALHVRTGWADEMKDGGTIWMNNLQCEDYEGAYVASSGKVIRDGKGNSLESIVLKLAKAADGAFGKKKWEVSRVEETDHLIVAFRAET
jgi:hypothetical protein